MVTLKEIAKAVGVSTATASRVLNFDHTLSISQEKRRAILETAEAMNYINPRERFRPPVKGRIAIVHFQRMKQELVDPYYVSMRLGIENRCRMLQLEFAQYFHENAPIDPAMLQGVTGVVLIGRHDLAFVDQLIAHGCHVVFADDVAPSQDYDSVEIDLERATHLLLDQLRDAGYRRIGFAGWAEAWDKDPFNDRRCRAYIEWSRSNGGFNPELCATEKPAEELAERVGYQLAHTLLDQPQRPDAIVTANDTIAVGVYRTLRESGLHIPNDVAVAGFNDISAAQFMTPPLTTVRLAPEQMGETAVDLLVERMQGRELAKRVILATKIIWRESTRQPKIV